MIDLKTYAGGFRCLHCEIEKTIEDHKWVGELTYKEKKWMIWKNLLQVLLELPFYRPK